MNEKHRSGSAAPEDKYTPLLLLTVLIWGSLYVVGKQVLGGISAFSLLFIRFFVASLALFAVCRMRRVPKIKKGDFGRLFCIGLLGYFLSNAMLLLGIQFSNASTSSLINAMNPIFIVLFARVCLGEPLPMRRLAALGVAVTGALIVLWRPSEGVTPLGLVLSTGSMLLWAYTSILIKKLSASCDPLAISAYGMGVAALFALPACLMWRVATAQATVWTAELALGVAYIALVSTALSYLLWNFCLARLDAARCASFYPLQPIFSALFAWLLLNERMNVNFFIGGALVLVGMLLNARPKRIMRV
ncbi:MAG: DMT family transporter [Candidatus Pelethousia sp.]|nr:DMT family transporter [Candidatus Pelethousia sp.]